MKRPTENPDWYALVDGIRANPADDLARLVAADWLDEHGETERAAFVRNSIERARLVAAHVPQTAGNRQSNFPPTNFNARHEADAILAKLTGTERPPCNCYQCLNQKVVKALSERNEYALGYATTAGVPPIEINSFTPEGQTHPIRTGILTRRGFAEEVYLAYPSAWLSEGGKRLAREHPVTRVQFRYGNDHHASVVSQLTAYSDRTGRREVYYLPHPEVLQMLKMDNVGDLNEQTEEHTIRAYTSEAEAVDAISRAALAFYS